MEKNPGQVRVLAQVIERYLADRPNASDTIEGIRRWWVGPEWADASMTVMSAALDLLVQRRIMKTRIQADGSVRYFSAARGGLADPGEG